jgi:hypothetical protein
VATVESNITLSGVGMPEAHSAIRRELEDFFREDTILDPVTFEKTNADELHEKREAELAANPDAALTFPNLSKSKAHPGG